MQRKRVLVTGASSGIGAASARLLLSSGYDVALMGRQVEELEKVAVYGAANGANSLVVPCDLADRESTDAALDRIMSDWAEIHGIVLNAGANRATGLDGPCLADFDQIVELNLTSAMRLVRGLLGVVAQGGRIIAVASVLGRLGIPSYHAYCASKAGLIGFVRALALELAPRQITVNAVAPGWVETPMAVKAVEDQALAMGMTPEAAREAFMAQVPLGRMLEPGEVGETILYLLNPASGGITGQALNIDCGLMA